MSGLDLMLEKFLVKVFKDDRKISRKEYLYRSCSVFRFDKKLAKEILKFLEDEGYVINRRENIKILEKVREKN